CMMLLALLATNASLLAQVSWVNGYPAWDANSETLTIGGDEGKLEVYFTTSQEITNAAVEFTLPANISYSGIENVNTAITYNAPTTSGQKVTVKVSSNGGTLASGSTVRFFLKLKAKCGAENGTTITVQTLTGASPVGTPGAATVQAQSPSFTIAPVAGSVDYDAADEFKSLGYKLKATNRDAKSFKLILTVDEFTTLKTFDWGGTTITPAMSNSNKTYTLTLTDLSSTEKTLSFEGASSRLGTHVVTPSIQYCTVETGFPTITLALPSVAGTPTLSHIGTNYVKSLTDDTEVDPWDIHMDGSTKNMVRAEFKNVGTADGYDLSAKFERYSSYSFLDTANIYYQIGGGSRTKLLKEHIKVSRVVENSVDYGYFGAHTGKEPVSVVLTLPKAEFLSIGETITFWIPTTNGKTYENEGKDVYFDYSTSVIKGFSSTLYANNEAGENKVAAEKIASIPYFGAPHFRELPAKLTIKPNEIKTQTIRIASGSIAASNKGKLKVYLQLPSWLKLVEPADGSFVWSSLDGTTVQSPESSDLTGKTPYRIYTGFADGEGLLTFTYTTDGSFSSSDSDQDGVISYYIDYDYNGQILDKISQVFQPVTLLCKEEGVVFEKLSLHRITRGLIDSNEDHIPDSNTPALDNEIDHTMYMIDDEGEIHWKARVLESSAYLYFPVTANGIAMQSGQRIDLKTAEVKVKRGGVDASYEVEVVNKTTTEFYLLVKAGATPFAAGDIIDVSLPFVATTASGAAKSFVSECFVSNMLINDPLNSKEDPARKGKDTKSQEIGVYDLNNALVDCSNNVYTFNDSGEKIWTTYANIFHNSPRSPYFKNEVRRHAYPGILSFELPDGYTLTNTSIKVRKGGGDAHGPAEKMLPPSSNSGNKYEYDFSSLYDLSYISGSGLDADKWILPDDRWVHYFYISVQATKGAVLGESTVKMKLTRKVPGKADVVQTINVTFNYNGTATQLSGLPAELPYFGSELTIPVATVGNPNQATLDKVWLYVEGNVENV
ncbi:hypothetical protein D0T51_12220, partial [Parabacteroides sp. 52]|uniref:hypothetical protein n=1 Tax=Parabacteroides sp. 52 TaxID=2302940 RepID=UPI0013D13C1E